jgi:hypothetical protein
MLGPTVMIFYLLHKLRCSLERILSVRRRMYLLEEILRTQREELDILLRLEQSLFPPTAGIRVCFTHFTSPGAHPIMASVSLVVGQSTLATIVPFEADGITQTPGAVVSAQSFSIPGDQVTIVQNDDGSATITAVAATTDDIQGSANATVTDADGTVGQFSANFTITVTGTNPPPPSDRTASIGVTFSTPA